MHLVTTWLLPRLSVPAEHEVPNFVPDGASKSTTPTKVAKSSNDAMAL